MIQNEFTDAQRQRKASGEACAARDRDNTWHARKCKLTHLTEHLPQALLAAFLLAVLLRVKARSERAVIGSLLLGFLVRDLFPLLVADQLDEHGQPIYTDIPVSQAAIPDLKCRNLHLCRGLPGDGEHTRPNAAVAAVLAAHPDLRARLEAIPRYLSDTNMVDHVAQQLQTASSNMLTLLFAGRLKKSVSLAGAKVLLGTHEHQRRFGQVPCSAHLRHNAEWLGVDPGNTNMATVAHEERDANGNVISVSSKPSLLASYRRFADTVLETYGAMWAEVSKPRRANAKFRLYCGKQRVVASFWSKLIKQAKQRWPDRILALAYGAAGFSGSGTIGCMGVPVSQMLKEASKQFP
ncbi:hypothetical protein QJQ45_007750 [Haematococcus lacustris]|nr:hypothetical protein QJQ45_007750 [Haematococcus lacustris]